MKVAGAVALVTGANRGLGLAFVRALLEAGAAKVEDQAIPERRSEQLGGWSGQARP